MSPIIKAATSTMAIHPHLAATRHVGIDHRHMAAILGIGRDHLDHRRLGTSVNRRRRARRNPSPDQRPACGCSGTCPRSAERPPSHHRRSATTKVRLPASSSRSKNLPLMKSGAPCANDPHTRRESAGATTARSSRFRGRRSSSESCARNLGQCTQVVRIVQAFRPVHSARKHEAPPTSEGTAYERVVVEEPEKRRHARAGHGPRNKRGAISRTGE